MTDVQDLAARRARLTPEQQALLQKRLRGTVASAQRSAIPRRPDEGQAPLSPAQQRQWFLWKLDPARTAYHLSGGLRLSGPLDLAALQGGLQALVARHESLRTVFREAADGGAEQLIQPVDEFSLPCIDLRGLEGAAAAEALDSHVRQLRTQAFDLTAGPLWRALLLQTGPQAHQLLVVMHHIVSDGWSVQLILDELAELYAARVQGRAPALAELPLQYGDYAAWQQRWLEDAPQAQAELAWWRDALGTEQPVLALQADHPRRADGRYALGQHRFMLDGNAVQRLRQRAQAEGGTLFMALLAGFHALLFRHSAQADLRVGVPIANRHRAETAGVVGFFVNTQVLRAQVQGRMTLGELFAQVRESAIAAQAHQDLPFERLVSALRPERSLATHPLFQVMFNHVRRDHRSLVEWPRLHVERLDFDEAEAQFELTLQTLEYEDGRVEATLLHAADLFDQGGLARMAGHYGALLQALAEAPGQALGDVPLLGDAEAAQLAAWSDNTARHDDTTPVHRLFEQHARQRPTAPALAFGAQMLSGAELNARANRLAHRLIARGVRPDDRVGIVTERSVEMTVGMLAILKAGGAYLPLDPEQPAERLAYMAQDSGISLLLAQQGLQAHVPVPPGVSTLVLDDADLATEPDTDPHVPLHGEHLAYVIYTSGSTGRPKGAAIRHRALASCMAWMQHTYALGDSDAVLHKAPFGFDVSAWEIFWPLSTGVTLVVAEPDDHRDPLRLIRLIETRQVTTLNFVPAMLQAFLAQEGIESRTKLRYVICGGEAMPAATQREALTRLKGASLQNLYGPTETTIHVTQWTCRDDGRSLVPIGRPISDTQAWVLDGELNPVPAGVAGELYLGGVNLARGYWQRPSLTAERFVATSGGERLYRTGDLVRWNREGQLDYLGRIDHQVKIRGLRIELGEVEAELLAQPGVREAVVVAVQDAAATRLAGYVSPLPGHQLDTAALRAGLARVLPDFMVPAALSVLPVLPLNANGKVDRKALPALTFAASQAYEAPQGEVEATLASIWAEVLRTPRVGRHDNFFELGGDSILSLQVVARAHRAGLSLTPRQMLQHQTPRQLAQALRVAQPVAVDIPALPAEQRARGVPLSSAQLRQWFLWQLDPTSSAYHISGGLRLRGELDVPALRTSFAALVQRHESLRTVFRADEGGQVRQFVQPGDAFSFEQVDIGAGDVDPEVAAQQLAHRPFDLATGPLLRAGLLRLGAQDHLLVVVVHHIVSDGWSMQVLVQEFVAQYRARLQGEAPVLRPLPLQYADYAAWQQPWLATGEHARQLAHWRAHLGPEQPVLQLPADRPRRSDGRYTVARLGFELPASLVRGLQRLALRHQGTLFAALLAGWQMLLYRHTGQPDVRVGVPMANRHRPQTEGVIGLFVNTQVLRAVVDERLRLRDALKQACEAVLGAQAHQDLPFEQLVEALQPERQLGTHPLFQALFNHQRGDLQALDQLPGLRLDEVALGGQGAQFELTLETSEGAEGQVRAAFVYAAELFDESTMERLAAHYQVLLKALAEDPDRALGEVELLGEAERARLAGWGENLPVEPDAQPVHRLFEQQVARQPDVVALIFGDTALSYAELDRRANRLAHHLIGRGVRPDTLVGIALERSIDMVVGLLAILKAGGAYVPLDPEYPVERLAYMVADSGISLLLTHSHLHVPQADGLQMLALDTLDTSGEPARAPQPALHGEHLAYAIYTSGSTGRPKGAANRHVALHNRLAWMQQAYRLTPADTVLQKTPFSFDVSVWEFFWPLMSGAKLVLAAPGDHRDPARLVELIRSHRVTTLHFVPSMLQAFMAHAGVEHCDSLKRIVCSGEALPAEAQNAVLKRLPNAALHNLYGPTEAAIDVTHWTCRDDGRSQVPIGRPISGTTTRVLDAALNLAPEGVAGELVLGGIGLARGYLGRPGLTAERFIAAPNGERQYRTGDLVRWNGEGQLHYLGRLDHQVKIRGFRIELGEIEAQLLAQPGVREAVVVARDARLVAYVSAHEGATIEIAALRQAIAATLPEHMLPSAIVQLPTLPLNANGKVDRKALPQAEFAGERAYEAPQGEVEQKLAGIWAEVLGAPRVGRHDNFFELGGHSLLALRLLERLREGGFRAPVRLLFEHPELAGFARAVSQSPAPREVVVPPNGIPAGATAIEPEMLNLVALDAEQIARIVATVPGGAANVQDIYPLVPMQEGMLFHHLLQDDADAYVTQHGLGFERREQLEQFVADFNRVIARHDILRTAVLWEGLPEPVQVVYRQAPLSLQWVALPPSVDGDALAQLAASAGARIDVRRAPMLQALAAHDASHGRWLLQVLSHHLIDDNTTLRMIGEEIALIQRGRAEALPAPVPFRHFVAQARLGHTPAEHEAFFTRMLGDVEEPTAPFGLLDVQGDGVGIQELRQTLAPGLALALRQQVQRHGVSAASLFHLAWALVLARTTGRDDVVFGTVLFGRLQGAQAERAIGLFVNTLPLRIRLGTQAALPSLQQTQAALAALMEHEHASLTLAQRCSALPAATPLFSALLNYRHTPMPAAGTGPAGLSMLSERERTNFPFTMSVNDLGDDFVLVAQITQRVDAQRLCGFMVAAVQGLVEALSEASSRPVCEIALLGDDELQAFARWGAHAPRATAGAASLHRRFERQAALQPDAVALVFGGDTLSYGELNARANRLAHLLVALGVRPEHTVGIAVERSFEMMVGLLAILKAGGAYVPLDPEYPAERLAWLMADSGVSLLLTHSALTARLPDTTGLQVLVLDTLDLAAEPADELAVDVHGENLAYVIYTSGSTGKPKGAQLSHRNVTRLLDETGDWFRFGPADTWTMFHSYAFDFSVWEIFGALCSGGRLVIVPFWVSRSPEDFLALLREQRVTVLNQTPSAFGQLVALPQSSHVPLALRWVVFGGEALDPQRLRPWMERHGDAWPQLINMYGITETTVHVTFRRITEADLGTTRSPVGEAIPDLGLRVLDAQLNATPIGVPGELHVSGAGLARGYLRRAGLTAGRFVAAPDGERLYRTGDRVRWTADGQLDYLGRIDHQVKVRGFRIELGEIEAQLLAQPGVREALVLADEGPGGTRLVAYLSPVAGHALDTAWLREQLAAAMPAYMVPAAFVTMDTLPLNVNGKVDRRALPAPDVVGDREHVPPQGELETRLAAVWAEVLGVTQVGRHDNFFELGGHSLLALRLLERLREQGFSVPVRTLFQQPELAAFAAALTGTPAVREVAVPPNGIPVAATALRPEMLTLVELDAAQIARVVAAVPGGAANVQDIYPLVPLQEGMLFHHLLQAQGDAYVTLNCLSFDSRERLERFVASFNLVIARHDILRTAVLWEGLPEPVQVVHRQAHLALTWLGDAAEPDGRTVLERLNAFVDPTHYRIDVRQAPMLRAVAAHDAPGRRWLLQVPQHHLGVDHTTLELIVQEIALLQQGRAAELPEPVPFRRFVGQVRLGLSRAEHEAFFTHMLGDVDEPTAPFGRLDVQGDGSNVGEARLALDDALAKELRRQAQRHGVSAATLFHLAWALVVGQTSGRDDVVFGTVLLGRMQGGAQAGQALGMFINTLPVRAKLGARSVAQGLREMHTLLSGLMHHEHASLTLAQRCSGVPERTPLFTALLNYRYNTPEARTSDGGTPDDRAWEGMEILDRQERTNYPFDISVDDMGEGFALVAQVEQSLDPARICRLMLGATQAVVQALASEPDRPVRELDILPALERQQLAQWAQGGTVGLLPAPPAVHRAFERQAAMRPDAVALVFGSRSLSYDELNRRANQLAHRLMALGVRPEQRVGIAVERSIEMVVGLLAVLKAGAAYVPLDPEYPAERLAYMLQDSGIAVLLTQQALRGRLQPACPVLELDVVDVAREPATNPDVHWHGAQLAYVIYTSGSTGRPKGVGVSHQALADHAQVAIGFFGLTPADRMLQFATLNFDGFIEQLYPPLCTGAAVVLRGPQLWDSETFHRELIDQQISVADLTTAYWFLLAQDFARHGPRDHGVLRQVHAGGEAMPPEGLKAWRDAGLGHVKLLNTYGPTEATVTATVLDCTPFVQGRPAPAQMPIGSPLAGRRVHVVDAGLDAVPPGVPGELCIAGDLLARGYLNRPGLSAERFIADPFGGGGGRLYRTGDLVRWSADGQLEYLGRIDHQVKVRGFRIELGEVEAQLLALEGVREAVVVAQQSAGAARLVAYVSAQQGHALDGLELRQALARPLPDYMVPGVIVVLDKLPLNPNGKLDRKALPAPDAQARSGHEPPQGEVEGVLAAIWAGVLGLERVGRGDDFFELGGHSLAALQVQTQTQAELGVQLPLRTYFEQSTLAGIARSVSEALQTRAGVARHAAADLDRMASLLEGLEE